MRPRGIKPIALLMFLGAVVYGLSFDGIHFLGVGTLREPWLLALSIVDAFVGIGLLRLSRWARLSAVVIVGLGLGLQGITLANALLHPTLPVWMVVYIIRMPLWGLVLWYLLTPEVRLAFARASTDVKLGLG